MNILLQWENGRLVETNPARSYELLVADSWLIRDAQARWADRHLARFRAAATTHVLSDIVASFLEVAANILGDLYDCWPRLELQRSLDSAAPVLAVRMRPAPQGNPRSATVWLWPEADPRRMPRIKGPDLDLGRHLRAQAPPGCDEVIVSTADGSLREGVWSSLVHWQGEHLVAPSTSAEVLPGVTRDGLLDLALADGVDVLRRDARLADLDGCETWLLSAVQGLRPVGRWLESGIVPAEAGRAAFWQSCLDAARRPIRDLPRDWSDRYT